MKFPFDTLEELFVSPSGFGVETATPVQRAICRIIQGVPLGDLAHHDDVITALGGYSGELPGLPGKPPREVGVLGAVRSGKSMIAAAVGVWASQNCDLSHLSKGEIPRYSVLSLEKDNAKVILSHLVGVMRQPELEQFFITEDDMRRRDADAWTKLIKETGQDFVGTIFIWHPSGRPTEIRVVAGKRAGGSLISRWSMGGAFDEAPRMVGASEGVINFDDARRALLARILPGCQLLWIGSPWAPIGPVYSIFTNHWGTPTARQVILKAPGPLMNPVWWTPELCADMLESDEQAYKTDVLAEFVDIEESLFQHEVLQTSARPENNTIPYEPGHEYSATMDPATRGNAWTLVICDKFKGKKRVVFHKQWIGSALNRLSPRAVMKEIAEILGSYKLAWCISDQWSFDAIHDIAMEFRIFLSEEQWTAAEKVNAFQTLSIKFIEGEIEIPNDETFMRDLKLTKKKATQRGVTIVQTQTSDGRHCDYASALALCCNRWFAEAVTVPPKEGEPGYNDYLEQQMEQEDVRLHELKQSTEWWEFNPFQKSDA